MNYRIKKLRKELMEQKPYVDGERCRIFTESMKKTDGLPIIIRRAKSFYEVLDQMTVWVKPGELIAGNQSKTAKGSPIYPEYSAQWILEELDGKPTGGKTGREIDSTLHPRMRSLSVNVQNIGMERRYTIM